MNAIIGMTEIGKKSDDMEHKNYTLYKINEASEHLLGIINDVLDMSKIEARKLELTSVSFQLNQLLQKAVSLIQFQIGEKQIQFSMTVDTDANLTLFGDDQRLTQVITNLLSNAVKFTPEGREVSLGVNCLKEENGLCELEFIIKDSGIGISAEQQEKLFNPFQQADSSTTRRFGGTGLGLVISRHIIELMDGDISVESQLDKGAAFIFTVKLPRDTSGNILADTPADDEPVEEEEAGYSGKRLLIVEDMAINREILIYNLEDTGLTIDIAENGKEAYEKVAANPGLFDLVFMDIQMPVMNGLEATSLIRGLGNTVPIIAMTANVFKEDIEACQNAGMDDHIGKPLDMDRVFKILRQYLK
jgi:CheY-like chemotaxis protein/two-component sensor histidine kinase